jgi:hypothetical protein
MLLDCCFEDEFAAFACSSDGSVTSQGNVEIETQARAKALPACIIPVLSDLLDRGLLLYYCAVSSYYPIHYLRITHARLQLNLD